MSACISREGEYSDHVPAREFSCSRCGVFDEDAALAEVMSLRASLPFWQDAAQNLPALVAENESLRAKLAAVEALVKPIYDRTQGQIGTHWDRCHEHHVGCLAVAVKLTIGACERSIKTTERGGTDD